MAFLETGFDNIHGSSKSRVENNYRVYIDGSKTLSTSLAFWAPISTTISNTSPACLV